MKSRKGTQTWQGRRYKPIATKQKQANKIINGASAGDQIMALKEKTGKIVSDPTAVKEVVRDFFADLGKPMNGLKGAPRDCPWS